MGMMKLLIRKRFWMFMLLFFSFGNCGSKLQKIVLGVEGAYHVPSYDDTGGWVGSFSSYTLLRSWQGCLENGIWIKPKISSRKGEYYRQSYGYYMGYTFLPSVPIIRPGIILGMIYDDKYKGGREGWELNPLVGFKFQVSILTFTFTDRSWGMGINYLL
jgi:hypothetical protein